MVMTRSYRLVAYLPAPLITEEALEAPCAGLAPGCFRGESLPHRAPNSTCVRIVIGHRRCSRSSFVLFLSAIGGGGRHALFARPQEGHATENTESRGPSVQ